MKKVILIVGGVVIIAVLGRVIWAYQQVKNNEARSVNSPALVAPVISEPIVTLAPIVNIPTSLATTSTSPKETFLAMGKDFKLLIVGKDLSSAQKVAPFLKSTEFTQFMNKYMTKGSMKEYELMPDVSKSMFFMFNLVSVLPDTNISITETINGAIATLNYQKNIGTIGNSKTSTQITANCSVKMIIENGVWKWERRPFTPDNVICTAS